MAARIPHKFFLFLAQVALVFPFSHAQGTTDSVTNITTQVNGTPGMSTGGLTTAGIATTTGSAGGTQQQPITTAATPGIGEGATAIPANTDIGTCFCDLTANACDVSCCCDEDCSAEDLSSFIICTDTINVIDEQVCLSSSIVYTENVPEAVYTSSSSLLCILIDNNEGRNYYTVPEVVDTVERFGELATIYGSTTFAPLDDVSPSYVDFYKAGDSIYTVYESLALGTLGLPRAGYSSLCDDTNPASFLFDDQTSCVRQLTNIATECETVPYLSALTFYDGFKLVPTPSYLTTELPILNSTDEYDSFYVNGSLVVPGLLEPVLCQDDTGQQTDCGYNSGVVLAPSYDTQCNNVLLEVSYTITHNSSGGIVAIDVQLVLGNIVPGTLQFVQKFSVAYVKPDETNTFARSGSPGYVVGMPVLAGNRVSQVVDGETRFSIELSSDRSNWLTVIQSTADGSCEANPDSRAPVNFGEELRTGCMVNVTFSDTADRCSLIQAAALNALNGVIRGYVATFGNSDVENIGDWVPVFVDGTIGAPSSSVEGTCNNMVMALHIEIIYANVGSLPNPQAKILGVRYNYAEGRTLKYTCSGLYCQTGAGTLLQNFEISSSVAFIDASTGPSVILAEDPGFEDKLPNDFFYPFTIGRSAIIHLDLRLLCLGLLGFTYNFLSFPSKGWSTRN